MRVDGEKIAFAPERSRVLTRHLCNGLHDLEVRRGDLLEDPCLGRGVLEAQRDLAVDHHSFVRGEHRDGGLDSAFLAGVLGARQRDHVLEIALDGTPAFRGGFSADGYPLADDDPPAPLASGIDRAIRLSTAAAVLAVAGIAAYVSYWHAYAVVRAHGETGITARLEPATIEGLVYASSTVVLYAGRHRVPLPALARSLLGLGIAATLTANMAQGWSHGPVGAVVAAWPAVSLVGSYELLVWLIRTSGAAERGPSAEHLCHSAACRTAIRSLPVSAVDGDRPGGSGRHASDPTRRPAGQAAKLPAIPANEQRDDEIPEASTVNDAAVAAYGSACRPAIRFRNAG
jgi:hypothetical protein